MGVRVGGTEPTSQHVCGHGVDFGFCFEHAEKCLSIGLADANCYVGPVPYSIGDCIQCPRVNHNEKEIHIYV